MKILLALLCCLSVNAATLRWSANTDESAGYRVYIGAASREYYRSIDVGTNTAWQLDESITNRQTFFTVTAYNADGLESNYGMEVRYPTIPPPVSIVISPATTQVVVQGSRDLVTWEDLFTFNLASTNAQFFRAVGK